MKNLKNQAIVVTIAVVIFISFLSLIYKSGGHDKDEKADVPVDIASEINARVEERRSDILEQKTQELANRVEELLKIQGGETQEVVIQQTAPTQPQTTQPAPTPAPAPKPAPVVAQPKPQPAPAPAPQPQPIPEPITSVS